jgi:hypothetical protein
MFLDFFTRLFAFFIGPQDPEAVKKHRLKQLAREIARNKYAHFYKARSGEITVTLGKFFYEIYKVIAPAKVFLGDAAKSALLRQIVVESFFDKNLEEIKERLTAAAIEERAKNVNIQDLVKSLDDDLLALSAAFVPGFIRNIDYCYGTILSMTRFITFDFFALLKQFDPRFIEWDFARQPIFTNINGEYLSDDIKEFLAISFDFESDRAWKNIFSILKIYRNGVDLVDYNLWNKALVRLKDVLKSGILELMVRHIDKAPDWRSKPRLPNVYIAEKYLEDKKIEIKDTVDKIAAAQKSVRRDALVGAVFGSTEIKRAKYYTKQAAEIYVSRNFDGFFYADALNCLMSFLQDLFKIDLKALCELLLIRGKWTVLELSRETSGYFYLLMEQADKLTVFDETFSDMGVNGSRLNAAIIKVDRDKSQHRIIPPILERGNVEALDLINTSLKAIVVINRNFNLLLEDRQKFVHNLVMNWDELEKESTVPLILRITTACKIFDAFIQLMFFLTNNEEGSLAD